MDWEVDSEVAQVDGLLAEWARRAPIDAPDALKLLGRERTFQAEVVRRFAVDALRRASDDELLAFLLQLVQALRYQPAGGAAGGDAGAGGEDAAARGGGGGAGEVGGDGGDGEGGGGEGGGGGGVSPLAQFLIERACKSLKLANFFYWYLRVELEDATHGHIYRGVQAAFQRAMGRTPESARVAGEARVAPNAYPVLSVILSVWRYSLRRRDYVLSGIRETRCLVPRHTNLSNATYRELRDFYGRHCLGGWVDISSGII